MSNESDSKSISHGSQDRIKIADYDGVLFGMKEGQYALATCLKDRLISTFMGSTLICTMIAIQQREEDHHVEDAAWNFAEAPQLYSQ